MSRCEPIKSDDFSLELTHEFVNVFKHHGGNPRMFQRLLKNPMLMNRIVRCINAGGIPYRYSKEEREAAEILGYDKVLTPALALLAWPDAKPAQNPPIHYSGDILRTFAAMNKESRNQYDWRLVYVHGFSLREQWKRHASHFSLFWREKFWKDNRKSEWMTFSSRPGYYMISYKTIGDGGKEDRSRQDTLISELGTGFRRVPISTLSEVAISEYYAFDEKYADFGFSKHWSDQLAISGKFVTMEIKLEGHVNDQRLIIHIDDEVPPKTYPYGARHGVCIYREPDMPPKPQS